MHLYVCMQKETRRRQNLYDHGQLWDDQQDTDLISFQFTENRAENW